MTPTKTTERKQTRPNNRRPTNAERREKYPELAIPDRDHVAKVMVEKEIADWLRMNGGSKLHYEILRKAYHEALIV